MAAWPSRSWPGAAAIRSSSSPSIAAGFGHSRRGNIFLKCGINCNGSAAISFNLSSMVSRQNRSQAFRTRCSDKEVSSVPVQVAHDLHKAGHCYLDVRTEAEFSAGHVDGAVNIPFKYRTEAGMIINENFVADVSARFSKDDKIIVGCNTGGRSMTAAITLLTSGFTGVTNISGGYKAWVQNKLT